MLSLNPVLFKKVWNLEYPINRVVEFQDNLDHSTYLGFKWVLTHLDRFPKGRTTTTKAGTQGGEKTHKLTVAETPSHNHINANCFPTTTTVPLEGWEGDGHVYAYKGGYQGHPVMINTGGDQPHNNIQPSKIGNRWHRTA